MDKEEYMDYYVDKVVNSRVTPSGLDFGGLFVLSSKFSKWRKDRKAKKQSQKDYDEGEELITLTERKVDTITI